MLCETCDSVFCMLCTGGSHVPEEEEGNKNQSSTADHTVIPLSIARKRMSEIVIYKANECSSKVLIWIIYQANTKSKCSS